MTLKATRYHPSAEQLTLGAMLSQSLDALLPLSRLHASSQESIATWQQLDELGIFKMSLPESLGGSGLGPVEEALIAMRLGARLASPGLLATLGATPALQEAQLGESGTARCAAAFQQGERCLLIEEGGTSRMLLRDTTSAALYLIPTRFYPLDEQLWFAALSEVTDVGEPVVRLTARDLLRLRLNDAAALAGIAQATLEMSVEYAGVRQQFGRPIGSFQAVKHHCANMAIAARCARDQTHFAAVAVEEARAGAALEVDCALHVAATAALENAGKNIQIHGAMGFSDEADPPRFLKRAHVLVAIAGGLDAAPARLARTTGVG